MSQAEASESPRASEGAEGAVGAPGESAPESGRSGRGSGPGSEAAPSSPAEAPSDARAGGESDPPAAQPAEGRPSTFEDDVDQGFIAGEAAEAEGDGSLDDLGGARKATHWDQLPRPLAEQLRDTGNMLWSEAAKALGRAQKARPLFAPYSSYARTANLGSLSNIPKPSNEANKRVCVVRGDLTELKAEAYIVPASQSLGPDASELTAVIFAKAGPQLAQELRRTGAVMRLGDACSTRAYNVGASPSAGGEPGLQYPFTLIHTIPPKTEDAQTLKSCYERSLYVAMTDGVRTVASPILAGCPYPVPGREYYPLVGSVHVLLSVLRTWLDRPDVQDRVDLFIICCATEREQHVLQELMPLYFPRDEANEESDEFNDPPPPPEIPEEPKKAKKGKKGKKSAKGKKGKKGK